MVGRRLVLLLVFLTAIGLPAGALRAACAGRSCAGAEDEPARVPFCPLPATVRTALENGYREGRSPDVMVVTAPGTELAGAQAVASGPVAWPSARDTVSRVPLLFAGAGVDPGAAIPRSTTLDRVAPTVAAIIGFRRSHPDVRSGTTIPGLADGRSPALVVLIAWTDVGTRTLAAEPDAWRSLRRVMANHPSTLDAEPGSVPLDPAAVLTTIGTGGLPFQHGITSSVVRNDDGEATTVFGPDAPLPVIASLAEDLDEANGDAAFIGLVAPHTADRGLIGGRWYLDAGERDDDEVVRASGAGTARSAERMLGELSGSPAGRDRVTDLLGVVLEGDVASLDRWTARIAATARKTTDGRALIVVVGTGDTAGASATDAGPMIADAAAELPGGDALIEDVVAGGVFLDQDVLARVGATGQTVVDALLALEDDDGRAIVRDAFQGFAVSFARYC